MLPARITAGDTVDQVIAAGLYPAPTWVLHFRLIPRSAGASPIGITCAAAGTEHRALVAAGDTASWAAGSYAISAWVESGAVKITIDSGSLEVLADPRALSAGFDGRSQAEIALDAARAALAAWTPTTRRYVIAGREREYASAADVLTVVRFWEAQVRREQRTADLSAGRKTGRQVFVRLGRA